MVEQTSQTRRRILVADDDPAILRLVKTLVEKEGYTVVTASDGREAYKILQNDTDFTAAIFDVVMPHIQGPELVRHMKTEKRLMKISVMMMTAEQNRGIPRRVSGGLHRLSPEPSPLPNFKLCCAS